MALPSAIKGSTAQSYRTRMLLSSARSGTHPYCEYDWSPLFTTFIDGLISPSNNSRKQDREALQIPMAESGAAHCQDGGRTGEARGKHLLFLEGKGSTVERLDTGKGEVHVGVSTLPGRGKRGVSQG